jgi:hypothetical protein
MKKMLYYLLQVISFERIYNVIIEYLNEGQIHTFCKLLSGDYKLPSELNFSPEKALEINGRKFVKIIKLEHHIDNQHVHIVYLDATKPIRKYRKADQDPEVYDRFWYDSPQGQYTVPVDTFEITSLDVNYDKINVLKK